jgi:hypothetical protein
MVRVIGVPDGIRTRVILSRYAGVKPRRLRLGARRRNPEPVFWAKELELRRRILASPTGFEPVLSP